MDVARRLIREPDVSDPRQYRRRVAELATIYVALFVLSAMGSALLPIHGRLFVAAGGRAAVAVADALQAAGAAEPGPRR